MDINNLTTNIAEWAMNKGLDRAEPSKQFLKVTEEVGEVAAALARGNKAELADGIGDVYVTLVILAMQNGLNIKDCIELAYSEIAGRTGKMVDGVFVKDDDLDGGN
ncbi:MazG-like family protein [Listeria monocytogenes]|uniref:MazG-like family protein n=1 Tax=Listeria monocytogenes TaxID=1639 RepID=UPI003F9D9F80